MQKYDTEIREQYLIGKRNEEQKWFSGIQDYRIKGL